jgi:hypothetical protein
VERAVAKGIPIVPFRIEDVPMSKALEYFISSPHWLDALTPPLERHLEYLARTVQLLLSRPGPEQGTAPADGRGSGTTATNASLAEPPSASPLSAGGPRPTPSSASGQSGAGTAPASRGSLRWIALGAVAVVAIGSYVFATRGRLTDQDLVGHWGFDTHNQTGDWHSSFVVEGGGQYQLETVIHDHGRVAVSGNSLQMISSTGTVLTGTYRPVDATTIEVTSAVGTVTWRREPRSAAESSAPSFVGLWDASLVMQGVTWHQTMANAADGTYRLTSTTADTGWIKASGGHWHMTSRGGHEADGTYNLINPQTLSFTGPLGASVWTKAN